MLGVVREEYHCVGNVGVSASRDVDKIEFFLHGCRHSCREARELFANILLERGTSPAAHFLNFPVGLSREGEGVSPSAAEGVRVNTCDRDAFVLRVFQNVGSMFEAGSHVSVRNVNRVPPEMSAER